MELHVSGGVIAVIIINLILSVALPLVAAIVIKKKKGGTWAAFGIGVLTMFVFAFVVEGTINSIVGVSPFGQVLKNSIVVYAIYGGFMAGLFEETGRFVAFKFFLKKQRDDDNNALMYGVGHGGIEVLLLLGVAMLNNLIYAFMINAGAADTILSALPAELADQQRAVFEQLATISAGMLLAAPVERISAMVFHIAASVLVWYAVKNGGKATLLYPLAILLHMGLDACAVIMTTVTTNAWLIEAVVMVYAVVIAIVASVISKKFKQEAVAV